MRIAVGTTGASLDALVGSELGWCRRFVIVDTASMSYFVVSQPVAESYEQASLAAIRTLAHHDVSAVIVAEARPQCREVLNQLGVDVIEGVEGLTVRQAVEHFVSDSLVTPEGRRTKAKVAIASEGDDLDAPVGTSLGMCSRFLLVDPDSLAFRTIVVTPKASPEELSVEAIRAVVTAGATVVVTPHVQPRCCRILFELGVDVAICPAHISVRQALEQFKEGRLASANDTLK
jgi:predicted Fe-Mo cluster-binding NifX family protein